MSPASNTIKLPKRNMDIINKAIKAMQRRPKSVDMDDWIQHDETVKGKEPYCGTAACLAGHIAIAATGKIGDIDPENTRTPGQPTPDYYEQLPRWLQDGNYKSYGYTNARGVACKVLRLDSDDWSVTYQLFMIESWPDKFHKMYERNNKAKAAIARLRHWLKTGE